ARPPTRSATRLRGIGPAPVERDVLARPALAGVGEAEPAGANFHGAAPGGESSGPALRARRIDRLDPLARRRRRPGQGFRAADDPARDLRPPVRQVAGDLDRDRDELEAAHLREKCCKAGRPAAGLAAEDRLQRRALLLVGPLVDEEAHPGLGLAGPDIAFELAERHQAEAIERDVAVMAPPDMPGEHAGAGIVGRRLGELAGARNAAAADVEPVAGQTPLRDRTHRT